MQVLKKAVRGLVVAGVVGVAMVTGIGAGVGVGRPQAAHASYLSAPQLNTLAAIRWASRRWGVSLSYMESIAWCESTYWPWAYNAWSGASGAFQFIPSTYWAYAPLIGEYRSYWSPWASANVAGYMLSRGLGYQWVCQ